MRDRERIRGIVADALRDQRGRRTPDGLRYSEALAEAALVALDNAGYKLVRKTQTEHVVAHGDWEDRL